MHAGVDHVRVWRSGTGMASALCFGKRALDHEVNTKDAKWATHFSCVTSSAARTAPARRPTQLRTQDTQCPMHSHLSTDWRRASTQVVMIVDPCEEVWKYTWLQLQIATRWPPRTSFCMNRSPRMEQNKVQQPQTYTFLFLRNRSDISHVFADFCREHNVGWSWPSTLLSWCCLRTPRVSRDTRTHQTTLGRVSCMPRATFACTCASHKLSNTRLHKPWGRKELSRHHQTTNTKKQGGCSAAPTTCWFPKPLRQKNKVHPSAPSALLLKISSAVRFTHNDAYTHEKVRRIQLAPPSLPPSLPPKKRCGALQARNQRASSHTQGELDIAKQDGTRCLKQWTKHGATHHSTKDPTKHDSQNSPNCVSAGPRDLIRSLASFCVEKGTTTHCPAPKRRFLRAAERRFVNTNRGSRLLVIDVHPTFFCVGPRSLPHRLFPGHYAVQSVPINPQDAFACRCGHSARQFFSLFVPPQASTMSRIRF